MFSRLHVVPRCAGRAMRLAAPALCTFSLALASGARAQAPAQVEIAPAPSNLVTLSATATTELTTDWLTVVFGTTREGPEAVAVQSQLRQALETALAEARRIERPGEVNVRTGGFSLQPRHATPQGGNAGIVGWWGRAELIVEGRDTAAIAQLMGRIRGLTVSRVGWSLSRQARDSVEGDVTAQAITRFRARAQEVARHFGLSGYVVREVSVSSADPPGTFAPVAAMRARGAADESLPVEAGKAQVSVTVSGTVQMK